MNIEVDETAEQLWNFAVHCYQRPGVAEACLALQERAGADVNLLLTGIWLAVQRRRWREQDVAELAHLCAGWRAHCLLPLREVRRYLKAHRQTPEPDIRDLYQRTKLLELAAERHQLDMIAGAVAHLDAADADVGSALRDNLEACLQVLPGVDPADCRALLDALQEAATPP